MELYQGMEVKELERPDLDTGCSDHVVVKAVPVAVRSEDGKDQERVETE